MNDFAKLFTKIFAPFCLFVITPGVAYMLIDVSREQLAAGKQLSTKSIIEMSCIVLIMGGISAYACQKSFGWFGGNKWED